MNDRTDHLKQADLEMLFHLRDNFHGRVVPKLSVYDPDCGGEHGPDWADDLDWFTWHYDGEGVVITDAPSSEGAYFAKEAASKKDLFFPFINFYIQHATTPDLLGIITDIVDDVHNLATCLSKIALYQHLDINSNFPTRRFAISEIEYIFSVCRSIYDQLQFLAMKSWERVQTKGKNQMPPTFSKVVLHGNDTISSKYLEKKYGIPASLAEFYEREAEEFKKIRMFRDGVLHHGKTVRGLVTLDEGYAVHSSFEPFARFGVWDEEFIKNRYAPLWPPLAHVIRHTLTAMNRFRMAIIAEISFPPEIAPGYNVCMRGEHLHNLGYLESLIDKDVWGGSLVEGINNKVEDSNL